MSNFKKLSSDDRRELFDQYKKLQECEYEIGYLIKNTRGWQAAKAYWFGHLSGAINDDNYMGSNPTFKSYLIDEGVMDEDEKFIEEEDEDEDENSTE